MSERGGRHRRRWLIAAGIGVIALGWLLFLGDRSLSAYRHDKNGLALLQQVKANLSPGALTSTASAQLLDQAHVQFTMATSDLSSPLLAPIKVVPVVGRQFSSVEALSVAAGTVSAVGTSFLDQVHAVLGQPHGAGAQRLASLRRLSTAATSAAGRLAHLDTGPSEALVSPLAAKHNQFVSQLDDVRQRLGKAADVSAAVAAILEGPQDYLVLAANNAEMRAGSGAFLDVGTATTAGGAVHLNELGPSSQRPLPPGAVPVSGDLQRNWGWLHPSLDFRNLGLTPQFPVTAPLAAQMWTAQTGQAVDGVLALDVVGLRQLLEASGPVQVGGQTVTAQTVEQYLLHDQYAGLDGTAAASGDRHDALGALASTVLRQLQGETSDLKTLASSVSTAVSGRHLMIWSKNPAQQAAWVASGASGGLTAGATDVSVVNVGGNKLDQYLQVAVDVSTRPSGAGTAVTMTAKVVNTTPAGQVSYIAGPFPGNPAPYGEYIGLVAANLPAQATHIVVTGGPLAIKGGEGPTWLVASSVTIPQGSSTTVVTRYQLPGRHGTITVVPSARVPAERWTANGRAFTDTAATAISW